MASIIKIPKLFHQTYRPMLHYAFSPSPSPISLPIDILRQASGLSIKFGKPGYVGKNYKKKQRKKKNPRYRQPDVSRMEQFALCDAMRYIRAFEVGRSPNSPKYELAVRLRTIKNGPVVRNRLRLPHAVLSSFRVGVICPSPSPIATAALAAGASVCGEETLIETIRNAGKSLPFDRLLCHTNSVEKLNTSGLGPILGPRGMMPSIKTGTVTKDVPAAISTMMGASEYRERLGVVRFAVGKLGFTPEQLRTNIRVFMEGVKRDISDLSDRFIKEIEEVVLSSTNAPGFTLNGDFKSPSSPPERDLTIL